MLKNKKVIVAMSGGVDSSIAAHLLVKEKHKVIGVNLQLFHSEEPTTSTQRTEDARDVCQKLGIPFYTFDYKEEFRKQVIDYFCEEYEKGKTPNPCIVCNEKIKFGSLLQKAKSLGTEYIATGHYAKIEYDRIHGRYILKKGKDKKKDQSYFLFALSQEQLKHTLFPVGDYTKEEVRKLAKKLGLKVHNKSASQDVCFIPDSDCHKFLRMRLNKYKCKSGLIINKKGEILGKHQGIAFYTIGQRKGLGPHKKPMYVIRIDNKNNVVVVGEEKELYQDVLIANNLNWIARENLKEPLKVKARIRYKHEEVEAVVSPLKKSLVKVEFSKPQRAITPGQAVVFYNRDKVMGGGWIT
jgi:tRNA-specific 2-thiouridylase